MPVEASSISIDSKDFSDKVLEVIQDNPEVLYKVFKNYNQKRVEKQQEERVSTLKKLKKLKYAITKSPVLGSVNSKFVLIEFSDFQCPYCTESHKTLNKFILKHHDEVALVYKHYPISQIHSEAMPAAIAAWAAHQQNRFWQYHDFLFAHQEQLGEKFYLQVAKDLGLNLAQFERDRKSQAAIIAIQKDMQLAEKLGISGTPFFIMNEETFSGAVQKSFLEDKLVKAS
jgi:protein-disulfide isomerase